MAPLLAIEDLSVIIPGVGPLLEHVELRLDHGERLGLVGESGCGKSMTALAIMGLLPNAARVSGRIVLTGRNLQQLAERDYCRVRGREIAMIFQEPMSALNPVKTIGHQIAEGLRLHLGLSRGQAEDRVKALLDRVGLPPARFSPQLYPHQLSGGQRQRIVIAMALACRPKLLIADEPTTALDVTIQARILDLISDLVSDNGMGLLLITHDLGVVRQTTDRVNVMYAGRIIEQGSTVAVFRRLAHPYSRGLFQAMPQSVGPVRDAQGKRLRLATIPGLVPDPGFRPKGCVFADRCRRVQPRCREAFPPHYPTEDGHSAACYFPVLEPTPL